MNLIAPCHHPLVMLNDINPFYSILIRVVYRLLTAGFFHVGFLHVVMNMLAFQVRTAHATRHDTHASHARMYLP